MVSDHPALSNLHFTSRDVTCWYAWRDAEYREFDHVQEVVSFLLHIHWN